MSVTITVPPQYIKTTARVIQALPSITYGDVVEGVDSVSFTPLKEGMSDEWITTFLKYLPTIDSFLTANDKERNPNRAYEHVISTAEFILLVDVKGRDWCQAMSDLIFDNEYMGESNFAKFLDDKNEYAGDGVESFIERYFINVETEYLERRDKNFEYGDVIRHQFLGYRNDGVYLYNGHQAVELAWKPDDYGTVPQSFPAIAQFPPQYFSDSVTHNNFIWLPKGLCYTVSFDDYKMGSGLIPEVEEVGDQPTHGYEVDILDNAHYTVLTVDSQCLLTHEKFYVVIIYNHDKDREQALADLATKGHYASYFNSPNLALIDVQVYERNHVMTG